MNIILINLTRFGDQLQSQAGINALTFLGTSAGEKNRVCLVCLPNFASSAVFLNNIELVCALPRDGFLGSLEADWANAAAELWQWKEALWATFKPDLVCNFTPSAAGRLLGRFLAGEAPLKGFGLDEFGFGTASPWAAFFQGSSRRRSVSPFNLVDLFRAVAGASLGSKGDSCLLSPPAGPEIDELLEKGKKNAGTGLKGLVAFQLGASEDRRRWPVEYFAELGNALWNEKKMLPLLLGSAGESELVRRYAQISSSPHLALAGRTNLAELARTLRACRLLVSNDTGTMHLAAGLGCPVLGIFLATAQCWDTGPYLPGSCSVEPGLTCHPCSFGIDCRQEHRCRYAVPPETLVRLCLGFISDGVWPDMAHASPVWPAYAPGVFDARAERARVWLGLKDEFGFMNLSSLSGHEHDSRTMWFREQRHFLRQFLDRDPTKPFNYAAPESPFVFPPAEREKLSTELALLKGQLTLLVELGKMLRQNPLPPLRERFITALNKASAAFENSHYMLSLGLLWRVEVQEQGDKFERALLCIEQYLFLISSLFQRVNK